MGEETMNFDHGSQYDRRFLYFMFRYGQMGYGPGFRLLNTGWRTGPMGFKAHGRGILTLKGDHDDWENYCGYHSGIYDCALQAGGPRGHSEEIKKMLTKHWAMDPGAFYDPETKKGLFPHPPDSQHQSTHRYSLN